MKGPVPLRLPARSSFGGDLSGSFACGLDRLIWGFEQVQAQRPCLRQAFDVGQGDVPAAALNRRDVGAVEFALWARRSWDHPFSTRSSRESSTRGLRARCPGRADGRWRGLGRHRRRMRFCLLCIYGVCITFVHSVGFLVVSASTWGGIGHEAVCLGSLVGGKYFLIGLLYAVYANNWGM